MGLLEGKYCAWGNQKDGTKSYICVEMKPFYKFQKVACNINDNILKSRYKITEQAIIGIRSGKISIKES